MQNSKLEILLRITKFYELAYFNIFGIAGTLRGDIWFIWNIMTYFNQWGFYRNYVDGD